MIDMKIVSRFLDGDKIKAIPSKKQFRLMVLEYLASKFEIDKLYTEKEVNELINQYQTASDHATLRRELYDNLLLNRDSLGHKYWRIKDEAE